MTFSVSSSLRSHRLAAGLTQSQLGKLTGLSQNSISSIERGEYGITLAHALMIARVLHCHVEDIWVLDDERLEQPFDYADLSDIEPFECSICFRSECVGCKLSCMEEYVAYQQRLGADADFRFG